MKPPLPIRVLPGLAVIACVLAFSADAHPQASPAGAQSPDTQSASVLVVVDSSSSAKGEMKPLKRAANSFLQKFGSADELALFAAKDKPVLVQGFTSDNVLVLKNLDRLEASGRTAIYPAIRQAVEYARNDAVNEKQAVVAFISQLDGADPAAIPALENTIHQGRPVPIYLVALGRNSWQSREWAQRLAVLSGGAAYFPVNDSEVAAISEGIAQRLGASPSGEITTEISPQSLRNYKTLLIRSIPVADNRKTTQFPAGDNFLLERLLTSRLQKSKLFPTVIDAPDPSLDRASFSPDAGSELELLATVVGYDRGHPGTPFGPTKLKVQVVLRDRASRQPIAAFTKQQAGPAGMFRGSQEKVEAQIVLGIADRIVEQLKSIKKR